MPLRDVLLPVLFALLLVALLEVLFYALGRAAAARGGSPPRIRFLYHAWAVCAGLTGGLSISPQQGGGGWRAAAAATAVLGSLVGFALFDHLVLQRPWSQTRGPMMPKLVRDVLRVLILVAAVLWAATAVLDYSLSAVLVSSTVLSAVIGLALQDVLKNVFSGVALELERPFARGDWILLEGRPMRVLDMSWRSVRLRDAEGVELYEPNSTFSTSRLTNYGAGLRPVALLFKVSLPHEVPPGEGKAALLAAARHAPLALDTPAPEAFVESYGDSAVHYRLRVWTRSIDRFTPFQDAVWSRVWHELHRRGLAVPAPRRRLEVRHPAREAREARERRMGRNRELLAATDLFRSLPAPVLDRLAAAARHERYDAGEVLVREGQAGDSLFVIDSGRVTVAKSGEAVGTMVVRLATLEAGDFFGEMSLLTGAPRSATVSADGPCEVLVLAREAVAPLLADDPHLADHLGAVLTARQAKTSATFEDRRSRVELSPLDGSEASILDRIRSFFRLD